MNTQKVAIPVPEDFVAMIDAIIKQFGISRSKFISTVLREKSMPLERQMEACSPTTNCGRRTKLWKLL